MVGNRKGPEGRFAKELADWFKKYRIDYYPIESEVTPGIPDAYLCTKKTNAYGKAHWMEIKCAYYKDTIADLSGFTLKQREFLLSQPANVGSFLVVELVNPAKPSKVAVFGRKNLPPAGDSKFRVIPEDCLVFYYAKNSMFDSDARGLLDRT